MPDHARSDLVDGHNARWHARHRSDDAWRWITRVGARKTFATHDAAAAGLIREPDLANASAPGVSVVEHELAVRELLNFGSVPSSAAVLEWTEAFRRRHRRQPAWRTWEVARVWIADQHETLGPVMRETISQFLTDFGEPPRCARAVELAELHPPRDLQMGRFEWASALCRELAKLGWIRYVADDLQTDRVEITTTVAVSSHEAAGPVAAAIEAAAADHTIPQAVFRPPSLG